jgi:phosphinothricin acetyltransferase
VTGDHLLFPLSAVDQVFPRKFLEKFSFAGYNCPCHVSQIVEESLSEIAEGIEMLIIRHATLDDLDSITEIYNEAVLKTVATFDTEPKSTDEQELWFASHGSRHPVLVAALDGEIVGWASLSEWSGRCAYSDTAEISLYVKEKLHGKGVGRKLLEALVDEGRNAGLHTVVARIAEGNEVSVHLHESVGFHHIGVMKEVGRKFGKLIDVHLMQKIYDTPTTV